VNGPKDRSSVSGLIHNDPSAGLNGEWLGQTPDGGARMQPHKSHRQVIAIVKFALFGIGLLLLMREPLHLTPPKLPTDPAPVQKARPAQDLDGDGQVDQLIQSSNSLLVRTQKGETILRWDALPIRSVTAAHLGGNFPVLFAETGPDDYTAFSYRPGLGNMQVVAWPDGQMHGRGRLRPDGTLLEGATRAGERDRILTLTLDQAQLRVARVEQVPLTATQRTPSAELAAAVEAAMFGLATEMEVHFADAAVGRAFYDAWHGKLPLGRVRTAQADEVDAGAENGHLVPAAVWVAGDDQVASISGHVSFVAGPKGIQIRHIEMDPIRLAVPTWQVATQRVMGRYPNAPPLQPSPAPFLGVFRFVSGTTLYTVDGVTGLVERD
jgi:hypothetical protein